MPSHEDKYITKLLMGFGALIAGTMLIFYSCFERARFDDWYAWGSGASFLICCGGFWLMQAFVHKVKSDLSRRQRMHRQLKTEKERENVD